MAIRMWRNEWRAPIRSERHSPAGYFELAIIPIGKNRQLNTLADVTRPSL